MTLLLVLAGGMVGAPLRHLTDVAVTRRVRSDFPAGTLVANVLACLVLGLVAGAGLGSDSAAGALLGTGLAGAMSTYSTFAFETVRLAEEGEVGRAALYAVASLGAGVGALAAGLVLA